MAAQIYQFPAQMADDKPSSLHGKIARIGRPGGVSIFAPVVDVTLPDGTEAAAIKIGENLPLVPLGQTGANIEIAVTRISVDEFFSNPDHNHLDGAYTMYCRTHGHEYSLAEAITVVYCLSKAGHRALSHGNAKEVLTMIESVRLPFQAFAEKLAARGDGAADAADKTTKGVNK